MAFQRQFAKYAVEKRSQFADLSRSGNGLRRDERPETRNPKLMESEKNI